MSDMTVARTIADQLGGTNRLKAMLGASNFTGSENTLSFAFKARALNQINGIRVILDPSDTYTVEFVRVRENVRTVVDSMSDVYFDMLIPIIEKRTGLALRL